MTEPTSHPNERIGKVCGGARLGLRSGDAGRIAGFLGPAPWTDELILDTARRYLEALGPRGERRRNRREAGKALRAAARIAGRPGIGLHRFEAPGCVEHRLVEDVPLALPLPLCGTAAEAVARVLLPAADDLIERARGLLGAGRRRAQAALAGEMATFGSGAAEGWEAAARAFAAGLDEVLSRQDPGWDLAGYLSCLHGTLAESLDEPIPAAGGPAALRERFDAARDASFRRHSARRDAARRRPVPGLDGYAALFPKARALGRRLVLTVGPTNSGKTHEALLAAVEAPSAVVLSPLRLLAGEHHGFLAGRGVAAGLVTGEERIGLDGATHVAATVEACDLARVVDVAVVDEVQMLLDPHRGWAWTQAIAGVPARTVMMTGSPDAVRLVESLAAITGEPLEVRVRERRAPLVAERRALSLDGICPGDAVVAFSRRAAMEMRDALQSRGHEVAMVYGNLSPDVRRAEAARFRSGEAGVLVATDAIGMGLNLPISRVVFSALEKFDGIGVRPLLDAEIRQIAGRAGRAGDAAGGGSCAVLRGLDPERLAAALAARATPTRGGRLYVRPTAGMVEEAGTRLGTDALAPVLRHLREHLVDKQGELAPCDLADEIALAEAVDRSGLGLRDKFGYACLPLSPRDPGALALVADWAARHAAGRPVRPPTDPCRDLFGAEMQAKRLTAYLWLGWRHPEAYPDSAEAARSRAGADRRIEALLRANPFRRRPVAREAYTMAAEPA